MAKPCPQSIRRRDIDSGIFISQGALREWAKKLLVKVGVGDADAGIVADSPIAANLRGFDTHGVTRMLGVYVKRIEAGVMNPVSKFHALRFTYQ